jgi:signal transduction histidine kinase
VRLAFQEGWAVLEVEDNGRGMEAPPDLTIQTEDGHYGLAGIHERVEAIKGQFELASSPGRGTTVIVKVPVSRP